MKKDDGTRSDIGLVVSLPVIDDKTTRLIFNDAKSTTLRKPRKWKPQRLFTWHEYDCKRFREMNLSKHEYANRREYCTPPSRVKWETQIKAVGRFIALGLESGSLTFVIPNVFSA